MQRSHLIGAPRKTAVRASALVGAIGLALGAASLPASGEENPHPVDHRHNVTNAPAPTTSAVFGSGPATKTGTAICTTQTQPGANVNTDCEGTNPHNETSIAVNPTNPANMIGGANDYQLGLNPGGNVSQSTLSRAHVTFDGGRTWSEYPITSDSAYQATGDPAVAFDTSGNAYYATLGFRFVGADGMTHPDVVVASSHDSGRTWSTTRVATGSGNTGSVGDFLDKEYIAAWGNGNAIVTYGNFQSVQKGNIVAARIYATVTHDAGRTWTTPTLISGAMADAFWSVPTVASDGRIYVTFMGDTDPATNRDTWEVTEVSPLDGSRIAGPFAVAKVFDGFDDHPVALGSQTYQDSIFRGGTAGNITADPTNPAHLAVVWSDMRNSAFPAPSDPYDAKTNSDVVVSQSTDRGRTWSKPVALKAPNDQFQPWGAYDTNGALRIGTFDRSADPANHRYKYSLATESSRGSLKFSGLAPVATQASDPTTGNLWFADTLNPAYPSANAFIGDYSNIAAKPGGGVVAYWTDLRERACFAGACGHGEDAYFASVG